MEGSIVRHETKSDLYRRDRASRGDQRLHAAAATLWCEACQLEVTMLGLDEASALAGLSNRTIFHLAETGEIHFIETAEGKAMFCVPSLRNQTPARGARLLNE